MPPEAAACGAAVTNTIHGSAAARAGAGVLLLGPSGAGKSDLLFRLLAHGFTLIADDQVSFDGAIAAPPPALAGLLEVRGIGIVRLPHTTAPIRLVIRLGTPPRLPLPARYHDLDVPVITLDPFGAAAPLQVALALDCAQGKQITVAGAFD